METLFLSVVPSIPSLSSPPTSVRGEKGKNNSILDGFAALLVYFEIIVFFFSMLIKMKKEDDAQKVKWTQSFYLYVGNRSVCTLVCCPLNKDRMVFPFR